MTIKPAFINCFESERINQVRNSGGIPRLSPDISYSTGNFSMLRDKHSRLQLDSVNNTNHRLETILRRTNWPESFFKDKLILECGCGAGPDTEVLLKLGAKVLSVDIAGLESASKNIGKNSNSQFLQASLLDLPLKKNYFDIVFCHRVLQHTPSPERVLKNILEYVKPDGAIFIHSYARTWFQMFRWKYMLRPITKDIDSLKLYGYIQKFSPFLYNLTNKLKELGKFGRAIEHFFVPFLNYRHVSFFDKKDDKWIIEYAIHDTFDALSPKYDSPLSSSKFEQIAQQVIKNEKYGYEIFENKSITLLRSKVT